MNELDQFVKHTLKEKYYLRYCDDFVIIHENRQHLDDAVVRLHDFLRTKLSLVLHPNKISIRKFSQGTDFLGYVILPHHITLRTKTKRRMLKKLAEKKRLWQAGEITAESFNQSLQSYLGVLEHGNCFGLRQEVLRYFAT